MQMPKFILEMETGPDHNKFYTVMVEVGTKNLGSGKGKTKKIAEQEASKTALKSLIKNRNKNYRKNSNNNNNGKKIIFKTASPDAILSSSGTL